MRRVFIAALLLAAGGMTQAPVASAQSPPAPAGSAGEAKPPDAADSFRPDFVGRPGEMPPAPVQKATKPPPRNAWGKPDFNGVWGHDFMAHGDKVFYAVPQMGGLPDLSMLQPWALKLYMQRYNDMMGGKQYPNTAMRCLPAGVPNIMMEAHAMQVILTKDEFIVLVESDHQVRIVPIGDRLKHDPDITPSWNGDSIAHWEGDTLVIDTVGLTDESELDPMSAPHTTQLHVVEKLRFDEYNRLSNETTLYDPGTFVRPWYYTYRYRKGGRETTSENVGEYACAENNRNGSITPEK